VSRVLDVVGIVPAAGRGTRLGLPFPKELWPLPDTEGFEPVAQRTLEALREASVRELVFIITHEKAPLIRYFGSGARFDVEIAYVAQERVSDTSKSAGLSDAIDAAYHLARRKVVAFGMPDTVVSPPTCFEQVLEPVGAGTDLALGLFETSEPERFGMVDASPEGRIRRIVDKPARTELTWMWGIAAWGPSFTELLHETMATNPTDFASVMNRAIDSGLRAVGVPIEGGSYLDLGTPADLARAADFV
jgi:glucose-1-phosphate thymidylyltransferase